MQFPEHTEESYIAAMEMGAGIVECDVAVTKVLHMLFKWGQDHHLDAGALGPAWGWRRLVLRHHQRQRR